MKQCYSPSTDAAEKNRPRIRNLALALLFALLSLSVGAQNGGGGSVSGIVKDPNGQPVLGVTVVVPGTTRGTTTDADGRYTIEAATGETLNFSYIGYKQQTLRVNGQTRIDVTLEEDNTSLEEVVVVGYGLQKRRDIVGAVETLSAETLEERNGSSMSISRSLQGAIPGLTMTFSDGKPNRAATIRIRGAENSIGAGGSALVLVDGVETDMSTVNPDDIESISVLTGPSAAALYGSDAANGAVLITTKKGEAGKLKVTLSSNTEFLSPLRMPEFQTRYGTGRKGKSTGSTIHSWGERLPDAGRYDYSPEDDFFETGHVYTNSFTLQGGSDRNQTYFSAAAVNSDGLTPNNEYNRYNFTFRNTSHFLGDRLTLDVAANYIIQQDRNMTNQGVYSNPLVSAYLFPRGDDFGLARAFERWNPARNIYEQYWPQGEGGDLRMQNPYWIAYRNPRENTRKRYMLTAGATYEITDWMDVSGRIKVDNTDLFYTQKLYATSAPTLLEGSKYGHYTQQNEQTRQTYGDVMLNITKTFAESLSLAAHAGASINDTRLQGLILSGPLAKPSNVFHPEAIESTKRKVQRTGWHEQTQSLFASVEVGWKSQLYLTLTGRNDWASQLAGSPRKSFFYPSVGLSWLPSETFDFPELFPYLKLRGSWASVGVPFPRELTYPTHPYDHATSGWDDKTNRPIGDLYPERTKSWELGFDARFLNGFALTASWYRADTYNQTFNPNISASSGWSDMYVQTGHVRNTGVEAMLGYTHTWRGFTWDSAVTFSWNENKIIELMRDWRDPETGKVYSKDRLEIKGLGRAKYILKEGGSMGDLYTTSDLRRNADGDIEIDDAGNVAIEDNLPDMKLGSVFPKYNLSWRNTFDYKGLRLSALVTARIGGIVYSATQANMDLFGVSEASAAARDRGGVLLNGRSMVDAETWYTAIGAQSGLPQYYTYSATNVRLQELSVGYTIPRRWLKVCDITVSLVGRNLWMMYCKAPFDPEAVASTENFYQGIDYFMTPSLRNIGFNVNIKF